MNEKVYQKLALSCVAKCLPNFDLANSLYVCKDHSGVNVPVYDSSGYVCAYLESEYLKLSSGEYKLVEEEGVYMFKPFIEEPTTTEDVYEEVGEDTLIPFLSNSGGKVSYYSVDIKDPISDDLMPYVVEFEDIALALGLTPMEYNIMKDIWRNANARTNGIGKDGNTQLRTYQKVAHYGNLLLKLEERK